MYSLDNSTTIIKDNLTIVINNINKLSGVFLKSKRIDDINNSTLMIDSITGLTQTKFLIDKQNFSKMLFDTTISENIFELKETISEDILSLYYKKYGKRESEDGDSERKGITVNVQYFDTQNSNYKLQTIVNNNAVIISENSHNEINSSQEFAYLQSLGYKCWGSLQSYHNDGNNDDWLWKK